MAKDTRTQLVKPLDPKKDPKLNLLKKGVYKGVIRRDDPNKPKYAIAPPNRKSWEVSSNKSINDIKADYPGATVTRLRVSKSNK